MSSIALAGVAVSGGEVSVRGQRPGRDPRPVSGPADGLRGVAAVALVTLLVVALAALAAVLLLWLLDLGGG